MKPEELERLKKQYYDEFMLDYKRLCQILDSEKLIKLTKVSKNGYHFDIFSFVEKKIIIIKNSKDNIKLMFELSKSNGFKAVGLKCLQPIQDLFKIVKDYFKLINDAGSGFSPYSLYYPHNDLYDEFFDELYDSSEPEN